MAENLLNTTEDLNSSDSRSWMDLKNKALKGDKFSTPVELVK